MTSWEDLKNSLRMDGMSKCLITWVVYNYGGLHIMINYQG
jgi:hypothetical protein